MVWSAPLWVESAWLPRESKDDTYVVKDWVGTIKEAFKSLSSKVGGSQSRCIAAF
jgi:hypothetical protein